MSRTPGAVGSSTTRRPPLSNPGLSPLQLSVLADFFALPESDGFVLAGGGALILLGAVDRTTRDLDFFTQSDVPIDAIAAALVEKLSERGLSVETDRSGRYFARLVVRSDGETIEVDLGRDSHWRPAVHLNGHPIRSIDELAVDKTLSVFGRAEARDFVDLYSLRDRYDIDDLLAWAVQKDRGFDRYVMAEMIGRIEMRRREDFAVDDATFASLRTWFEHLRARLIDDTVR